MSDVVAVCTVEISGNTYALVPDTAGFGRQNIPRHLRYGLSNGMRVTATRCDNKIVAVEPLPQDQTPAPSTPPPGSTPALGRAADAAQRQRPAQRRHQDDLRRFSQRQGRGQHGNGQQKQARQPAPAGEGPATGYFANPYNFVPFSTQIRSLAGLAEGAPCGHDRWHEGRYSAKLRVQFTTVTPLLSVELTHKTKSKPAVYAVRRDAAGRPIISGASIKGMLRSTYEQATGSRLGVFNHAVPESTRSSSTDAQFLKIAKVARHDADQSVLNLTVQGPLLPLNVALHPTDNVLPSFSVSMPLIGHPSVGPEVYAWVQLLNHDELKVLRNGREMRIRYLFWRVLTIEDAPTEEPAVGSTGRWDTVVPGQGLVLIHGRLHQTGKTFTKKRAERMFADSVVSGDAELTNTPLTIGPAVYQHVVGTWRAKLDSFQAEPFKTTEHGREVTLASADYVTRKAQWKALEAGQTLYLRDKNGMPEFYPALITREAFPLAPDDLLHPGLKPAAQRDRLTAADRVFGWVADEQGTPRTAHRALLRVGGVTVTDPAPTPPHPAWTWELATLNSPKPSNARFYTRNADGTPQHGLLKANGYQAGHQLGGHKVFPHHQRRADYWELKPGGWTSQTGDNQQPHPSSVDGHYQNYLAAPESKPDVSIAIRDWVEPGTTFETTLYADNLSRDELAALLWVVTLGDGEEDRHHRLGMGKPMGFGSLTAAILWDKSEILDLEAIRIRYDAPGSTLTAPAPDTNALGTALIKGFDKHFKTYPATYLSLLAAARGTDLPVHYPRLGTGPGEVAPQAETYQWFVENDKSDAQRHALPLLAPQAGSPAEDLPTVPRANRRKKG